MIHRCCSLYQIYEAAIESRPGDCFFSLTHLWSCQQLRPTAPQFWDCAAAVNANRGNSVQSPGGSCNVPHPPPRWRTAGGDTHKCGCRLRFSRVKVFGKKNMNKHSFMHFSKSVLLLTHFRLLVAFSIVPNELHIIPLHLSNAIWLVFRCMAWVSVLEQR